MTDETSTAEDTSRRLAIAEMQVERSKVVMESLAGFCHALGQPATVLLSSIELLKMPGVDEDTKRQVIDMCHEAVLENASTIEAACRSESVHPVRRRGGKTPVASKRYGTSTTIAAHHAAGTVVIEIMHGKVASRGFCTRKKDNTVSLATTLKKAESARQLSFKRGRRYAASPSVNHTEKVPSPVINCFFHKNIGSWLQR